MTACRRQKSSRPMSATPRGFRRVVALPLAIALLTIGAAVATSVAAEPPQWKPATGPLTTRWAADVTPRSVHAEYPRPQLVRKNWQNLNGLWEYAIRPKDAPRPESFDGQILVPFPVESALSGFMKKVGPQKRLWYRRTFERPAVPVRGRLLLHFGGVDWEATVWVNGRKVGAHRGGYDAFSFDVTDALRDDGSQEIVVSVWDPTDAGFQPRGKQVRDPKGIWYTSVTGIWQTVWLEPVPETYIERIKLTPDTDSSNIRVELFVKGPQPATQVRGVVTADGSEVAVVDATENRFSLSIPDARLWSPDEPFLYDLQVSLESGDTAKSYFGMRKIEVRKDVDGFQRLFLNGAPLFQFGPLDQGWWPDGLYTAPTDAALRYDIEVTKKLGMNMCRKHVKVEPARWYYWCDKLGLLVWQDLPNGDRHIKPDEPDIARSPESAANFRRELRALIDTHHNSPSIVVWVPFNEGWGQFETDAILAWTKEYDPTRLVDGPSGWADRGTGDLNDMHRYPGPAMPPPEAQRAIVLGEFGGLGWPVEGHLWWDKRNWGYRTYHSQAALQQHYDVLIHKLRPLVGKGLAAAIYTQTTDVEGEVNGLMTYDRALVKLDAARVVPMHRRLYEPPPQITVTTLVPTSEQSAQTWRFTTEKPKGKWTAADFDDDAWREGPGGFGERSTPGTAVRTDWKTPDLWLRRTFKLERLELAAPHLRLHHDEDAEIYINGKRVASVSGFVVEYFDLALDEAGRQALRQGTNTLAVHCHQTGGGQYIDVGLVDVVETPRPRTDQP